MRAMGITKGVMKYIQTLIVKSNGHALQRASQKAIAANEDMLRKEGLQLDETAIVQNT